MCASDMCASSPLPPQPLKLPRAVLCRTLQDYTLIHYDVNAWEGRAYEYGLETLRQQGVPVDGLRFDPDLVIRGLIMDKECGNLIKVDRFGCVRVRKGMSIEGYVRVCTYAGVGKDGVRAAGNRRSEAGTHLRRSHLGGRIRGYDRGQIKLGLGATPAGGPRGSWGGSDAGGVQKRSLNWTSPSLTFPPLSLTFSPPALTFPIPSRLVKRAMHGTRMLNWQEIRELYGREVVNLRNESRWVFLNTLFSVSEAVMYMQVGGGAATEGYAMLVLVGNGTPAGHHAGGECISVDEDQGRRALPRLV